MKKLILLLLLLLIFIISCKGSQKSEQDIPILFSGKEDIGIFVKQQDSIVFTWNNKSDTFRDLIPLSESTNIKTRDYINASALEIINFNKTILDTHKNFNAKILGKYMTMHVDSSSQISQNEKYWEGNLSQENSKFSIYKVGDSYSGWFFYENEQYEIKKSGDQYLMLKIDQNQFIDESEPLYEFNNDNNQDIPNQSFNDSGNVIDILICYTKETRIKAGGRSNIESYINNSVRVTNKSYENSNIFHRINLVYTHEVNYNETGNAETDVKWFRNNSAIKSIRDSVKADIAILFVENLNSCGIVYAIQKSISPTFETDAFSVVKKNCALGYYSLAHEIGHLMGCRHNCSADNNLSPFNYSHGYAFCGSGSK